MSIQGKLRYSATLVCSHAAGPLFDALALSLGDMPELTDNPAIRRGSAPRDQDIAHRAITTGPDYLEDNRYHINQHRAAMRIRHDLRMTTIQQIPSAKQWLTLVGFRPV